MYPIFIDYSIKKALKYMEKQTMLSEERGREILKKVLDHQAEKEAFMETREVKLELKSGELVSVSCDAKTAAKFSVKQRAGLCVVKILIEKEAELINNNIENLEIKIAVKA